MSANQDPVERFRAGRGYVEDGWPVASRLDPDFVAAVVEVAGRAHLYDGFSTEGCLLSVVDRELIATVMLAMQGRPFFAFNHVVRLDRMGVDRRLFLDAFAAAYPAGGMGTVLQGLRAFMLADGLLSPDDPELFEEPSGDPAVPSPRRPLGQTAPVLRYAESHYPDFLERVHGLAGLALGQAAPPPRRPLPAYLDELIPAVLLASRNGIARAAGFLARALARGATPRHVMEAAEAAAPMSGFPTILLTLKALKSAQDHQ